MLGTDAGVQIAGQDTFYHKIGLLSFHTRIVKGHGSAGESNGTIIHDIEILVSHLLAKRVAEDGSTLTVKVSLKSMSYGFV